MGFFICWLLSFCYKEILDNQKVQMNSHPLNLVTLAINIKWDADRNGTKMWPKKCLEVHSWPPCQL